MDHATQVTLARRLLDFLDRRTTEMTAAPYENPVAVYTSAAQLIEERRCLFRREPLLIGLSCDLAAPGAYVVHDAAGVPILVTRDSGGTLRAFLAVCRHRGARLACGEGVGTGRFTCPFHGWTYDKAGRLVSQPCAERFAGIDADTLSLVPLPVAERHGLVFARATPSGAIDVDAQLAGAELELAPFGLEHYVRFARREVCCRVNWKLVIDTFLEAYHVPTLHARTLAATIAGSPAAFDAFGRGGRMIATRRSLPELRALPEAEWNLLAHTVVLYNLFPNTMLIHQIDHVEVVQVYPSAEGPDASVVTFSLYIPEPPGSEGARRHFQSNFDLLLGTILEEDFPLAEGIQQGFHADPGARVIFGRNEPGVAHYQRMVREALVACGGG